jgi:hypothetical protein
MNIKKLLGSVLFVLSVSAGFSRNAGTSGKDSSIEIRIENTLDIPRSNEVIELDWQLLEKANPGILKASFLVENKQTGEQLPYQVITDQENKPFQLLVQASIAPASILNIAIKKDTPQVFQPKTFGRMVPERKDDFAWENDKIAFRMYGPALQATGEISNGIDVWVKRTSGLIIDKWYKLDDYHVDHGEGLDCYKVGPTLGAGGIAPTANGKLYYSKNWASYKTLTSGILRTVFELSYTTWNFNGTELSETKRITLNSGSQLNKVEVTYKAQDLDTIPVAIGIVKRTGKGVAVLNEKSGTIAYWEPLDKQNGTTGIGLVVPESSGLSVIENHLTAFGKAVNKQVFTYYQGACWDKAGEFVNEKDWEKYLQNYSLKLKTPLKISIN